MKGARPRNGETRHGSRGVPRWVGRCIRPAGEREKKEYLTLRDCRERILIFPCVKDGKE